MRDTVKFMATRQRRDTGAQRATSYHCRNSATFPVALVWQTTVCPSNAFSIALKEAEEQLIAGTKRSAMRE